MDHADLSGIGDAPAIGGISEKANLRIKKMICTRFADSLKCLKIVRGIWEPVKVHQKGQTLSKHVANQEADKKGLNTSVKLATTDA